MNARLRQRIQVLGAFAAGYMSVGLMAVIVIKKLEEVNGKLFQAAKDNHDLAVKLAQCLPDEKVMEILDDFQFELMVRDLKE